MQSESFAKVTHMRFRLREIYVNENVSYITGPKFS
jgi:hypothetical protein